MEQAFYDFVLNASTYEKGFILMAVGILFVFSVQLVFYSIVKLWPKEKNTSE